MFFFLFIQKRFSLLERFSTPSVLILVGFFSRTSLSLRTSFLTAAAEFYDGLFLSRNYFSNVFLRGFFEAVWGHDVTIVMFHTLFGHFSFYLFFLQLVYPHHRVVLIRATVRTQKGFYTSPWCHRYISRAWIWSLVVDWFFNTLFTLNYIKFWFLILVFVSRFETANRIKAIFSLFLG